MQIIRLVSGGQTGPDRAALDVARELGLPYGGWVSAGGWAEDHPQPPGLLAEYPCLAETDAADPRVRTGRNITDSDATLIVRPAGVHSPGTDLTEQIVGRLDRPVLVTVDAEEVRAWIDGLGPSLVLNIAGPRASEWAEGYAVAHRLLRLLLTTGRASCSPPRPR